jgi:uncharacterized protein (DUF488 family)
MKEQGDLFTPHVHRNVRLLMVGHSNHTFDRFAELLTRHQVTLLVDVRSSPQSRFCPHFNAKRLALSLAVLGIRYLHAPQLGGKNPLPVAELRRDVAALLPLTQVTALMCSEGKFQECHRHYLLTPLFVERGVWVEQILPDGALVPDAGPTEATLRKMRAGLPAA